MIKSGGVYLPLIITFLGEWLLWPRSTRNP